MAPPSGEPPKGSEQFAQGDDDAETPAPVSRDRSPEAAALATAVLAAVELRRELAGLVTPIVNPAELDRRRSELLGAAAVLAFDLGALRSWARLDDALRELVRRGREAAVDYDTVPGDERRVRARALAQVARDLGDCGHEFARQFEGIAGVRGP
jgi:hypothetical protein